MEQHMTPEEVAGALKVSVETVYRWCRAGLGQKFGGQYRITKDDIAAFFPKGTAHGVEPAKAAV